MTGTCADLLPALAPLSREPGRPLMYGTRDPQVWWGNDSVASMPECSAMQRHAATPGLGTDERKPAAFGVLRSS